MKENINEHDMTKKMLDVMRGGYKSKLLTEQNVNNVNEEESESPDTIDVKQGDAAFRDESKKLRDIVSPQAQITNLKVYPTDRNVIMNGDFSGVNFKMSITDKLETTMDNAVLDDDLSAALKRLKGYYSDWVNQWSNKLITDYPPKKD